MCITIQIKCVYAPKSVYSARKSVYVHAQFINSCSNKRSWVSLCVKLCPSIPYPLSMAFPLSVIKHLLPRRSTHLVSSLTSGYHHVNKTHCQICEAGFYTDLWGQWTCRPCQAFQYQPVPGSTDCLPCDLNKGTQAIACHCPGKTRGLWGKIRSFWDI